jgi:hypothetical protein
MPQFVRRTKMVRCVILCGAPSTVQFLHSSDLNIFSDEIYFPTKYIFRRDF